MTVVPDGVPPARAVLAGTVETAVNALWDAAPLVGDRVAVVGRGHGRLLRRRGCSPASPASGCSWSTSTRAGGGRRGARRRVRAARRRRRRLRPRRAHQRDVGRAAAVAGPARRRGQGDRAELVRRPRGRAAAGRGVPLAAAWRSAPARSARSPPARRGRRRRRPAGAGAASCSRDPAFDALRHRRVAFDDLPEVMPRLAAASLRRCATAITYGRRSDRVQRHRPRPHDDRPQLPRRGLRSGAAPARGDVRRRRDLPPGRRSTPTTSSSTSAGRPRSCGAVLGELNYRNLDEEPASPASTPPPSTWPG